MSDTVEYENAVKDIANYAARHVASIYEVAFPEGDCYRCRFSNSEYDDNDEELDSPGYEEWYVVDFKVVEIVEEGPIRILATSTSPSRTSACRRS